MATAAPAASAARAARAAHAEAQVAAHVPLRPRARQRPAPRPRVARGAVLIAVVGALLAGIVAINVAVLRANLELDKLGDTRTRLRSENAELASKLSSAQAAARIQSVASAQLGLVPASPAATTYLDLDR
jgi:cell division protein FtsL